jgi:excinuclease ABC subunit A
VWSLDVTPANENELRDKLATALEHGKGVVHVLARGGANQVEVFSTKRACPVCSTSYAELDPRLFSYNSKHGWCPDCVGTGVKLTVSSARCLTTRSATTTTRAASRPLPSPRWKTWPTRPVPPATARG